MGMKGIRRDSKERLSFHFPILGRGKKNVSYQQLHMVLLVCEPVVLGFISFLGGSLNENMTC